MASRGDYQKQLAALWATARAHNLNFEDIVPEAMKEEFSQIRELNEARELIKGFQEREEQLQAAKKAFAQKVSEKQLEIDNLPAEYQSAKIDLQQAQRQIAYHKDTIADLNDRVERYRAQADGFVAIKQADAATTQKLENLQIEVQDQQTVMIKLKDDNRKSIAMFEQLLETDAKALEHKTKLLALKDIELARKEGLIAEKESVIIELRQQAQKMHGIHDAHDNIIVLSSDADDDAEIQMENNLLTIQEQNVDLLQRNLELSVHNIALEEQHIQMKMLLDEALACHESSDRNFAAIVSETKTLFRFYRASSQVLCSFASFFSAPEGSIPNMTYIGTLLNIAQEALSGYFEVKDIVRFTNNQPDNNNQDQIALYRAMDSLAASASDSAISLETLHSGLWLFLNQLSHDPKMLSDLNSALCDHGRVSVVD